MGTATRRTHRELVAQARPVITAAFPRWVAVNGDDPDIMEYTTPAAGGTLIVTVRAHEGKAGNPDNLEFTINTRSWPRLDSGYYLPPREAAPSAGVSMNREPAALAADITRRVVAFYEKHYPTQAAEANQKNTAAAKRVQLITDLMATAGAPWPHPSLLEPERDRDRRKELYENNAFHPGRSARGKFTLARTITVGSATVVPSDPTIQIETGSLTPAEATAVLELLTQLAAKRPVVIKD